MISCEELLRLSLVQWSEAYGRKLKPSTIDWWLRLFEKESPSLLAKAIQKVSLTCERMPSPGHVTKVLSELKESLPSAPSVQYSYRRTVAKDSETGEDVDAIVYDHDPNTICYRAPDCPEGRAFLNQLAAFQSKQRPFPTISNQSEARAERNRQKREWIASLS